LVGWFNVGYRGGDVLMISDARLVDDYCLYFMTMAIMANPQKDGLRLLQTHKRGIKEYTT